MGGCKLFTLRSDAAHGVIPGCVGSTRSVQATGCLPFILAPVLDRVEDDHDVVILAESMPDVRGSPYCRNPKYLDAELHVSCSSLS
jgi:hypothetical protein